MEYKSVVGETLTEKTIEKSKFLSYIAHTAGEEEARAFLSRVRALHPAATHVCFGYIADKLGNEQRFSDDGEPQGTAGMPILGVLKAQELRETAIAVVRYFGGIKLGAGGLTRAYAGGAADCVAAAEKRVYAMGREVLLEADYSEVNALMRFLEGEIVLSKEFRLKAEFAVIVREEEVSSFSDRARDCLNGRIQIAEGKRYFYPFPS